MLFTTVISVLLAATITASPTNTNLNLPCDEAGRVACIHSYEARVTACAGYHAYACLCATYTDLNNTCSAFCPGGVGFDDIIKTYCACPVQDDINQCAGQYYDTRVCGEEGKEDAKCLCNAYTKIVGCYERCPNEWFVGQKGKWCAGEEKVEWKRPWGLPLGKRDLKEGGEVQAGWIHPIGLPVDKRDLTDMDEDDMEAEWIHPIGLPVGKRDMADVDGDEGEVKADWVHPIGLPVGKRDMTD
jgi:hypothetical protein